MGPSPGTFAQNTGGAEILMEHRYCGETPYDNMPIENLQYLTLDQAFSDMTYSENNFETPLDVGGQSGPKNGS